MVAPKRPAAEQSGDGKRRRISEPTAAANRPRRSAKAPPSKPEPVATESRSKKSGSKAKTSTLKDDKKPAKAEAAKTSKPKDDKEPAEAEAATAEAGKDDRSEEERSFWLMKAEPESRIEKGVDVKFSIHDLAAKKEPEPWDGVRNPVAQKNMRSMKKGDLAFFYHSNCKVPGIAGVMQIVQEHSIDESAFDPKHPYYDPKSNRDKPRWCVVHVEHVATFDEFIPLKTLQQHRGSGESLAEMQVLRMSRLSVSKVSESEWAFILKDLAGIDPESLQGATA